MYTTHSARLPMCSYVMCPHGLRTLDLCISHPAFACSHQQLPPKVHIHIHSSCPTCPHKSTRTTCSLFCPSPCCAQWTQGDPHSVRPVFCKLLKQRFPRNLHILLALPSVGLFVGRCASFSLRWPQIILPCALPRTPHRPGWHMHVIYQAPSH